MNLVGEDVKSYFILFIWVGKTNLSKGLAWSLLYCSWREANCGSQTEAKAAQVQSFKTLTTAVDSSLVCPTCGRSFLARIRVMSHVRTHRIQSSLLVYKCSSIVTIDHNRRTKTLYMYEWYGRLFSIYFYQVHQGTVLVRWSLHSMVLSQGLLILPTDHQW